MKYNWVPLAGVQYIDSQEAARLACENPDYAGKDLYDTIAQGKTMEYGLYVQLMNPQDEATLPFDPLDDTKVWDVRQYPLLPVGKMVLDTNPDNYKEQVEKLAFAPSNMLDGAEFSLDRVLQGRANIYTDSQRYRLGPNFRSIPINHQADWKPSDEVTSGTGNYAAGRLERTAPPKSPQHCLRSWSCLSGVAADCARLSNLGEPGTGGTRCPADREQREEIATTENPRRPRIRR